MFGEREEELCPCCVQPSDIIVNGEAEVCSGCEECFDIAEKVGK